MISFLDVMRRIAIFVVVVAAALLAGCQTTADIPILESGDPSLDTGSVLWKGVDGHLYVATAGESALTRVTRRPDTEPEISYTAYAWAGDRVVYAAQEVDRAGEATAVLYSAVPGRNPRQLLSSGGAAPFFLYPSPDGSRVAYLGPREGQDGYVLDSIGIRGSGQLMHGTGRPFYSAWSPDSTQLLTHVGLPFGSPGSFMRIQSVSGLMDGRPMAPPLDLETGPFQAPAYAPDGSTIAVVLREDNANAIHLLTADGRRSLRLRDLEGWAAIAWSPNGDRLAYVDGRASMTGGIVGKLWVTNQRDGRVELITEQAAGFFWSPDNSKLLYFEPYVVRMDKDTSVFLYRIGVYHTFDGRKDVLGSIRPTSEFVRQIMPFFDQYHRAYTIWSPDSRLVALNAVAENGAPVVHLVDTELRRTGDAFSVTYRMPTQAGGRGGFFATPGVTSRILGLGTVPFFNSIEQVRPGTVS